MPLALECSVAITAACHLPFDSLAAFKPVQWGVVEQDPDALYPHCSFTSFQVREPETNVSCLIRDRNWFVENVIRRWCGVTLSKGADLFK
jgi:hypothetical protein